MPVAVDRWSTEFSRLVGQHAGVTVEAPDAIPDTWRVKLGPSLATFQLGESGTGEHLLAAAAASGVTEPYTSALKDFIVEEQEHSRLLALVLETIGHPLRTSHWTDSVFVQIRRLKSLRTEVLTLLIAELIALRYYSALRDGIDTPALQNVFARIHADEIRHIDFHAATLPPHIHEWPAPVQAIVRLLWNVLVTGTSIIVALDHRAALRLVDMSFRRFVADVWHLRRDLDQRLFLER